MKKLKETFNMRLTPEAIRLIRLLAAKHGVALVAIVEMAIREKARAEGIEVREQELESQ